MFKFQLALRLGRTVSELDQTMSAKEFDMWQAFNYFEPVGVSREDTLFGHLALVFARSQGAKEISLSDLMIFKKTPELVDSADVDQGPTKAEIEDMCVNMKAMFSKVV